MGRGIHVQAPLHGRFQTVGHRSVDEIVEEVGGKDDDAEDDRAATVGASQPEVVPGQEYRQQESDREDPGRQDSPLALSADDDQLELASGIDEGKPERVVVPDRYRLDDAPVMGRHLESPATTAIFGASDMKGHHLVAIGRNLLDRSHGLDLVGIEARTFEDQSPVRRRR